MVKNLNILLPSFLLLSSLLTGTNAVNYTVTNNVPNTPGGKRFNEELGAKWTLEQMSKFNPLVWQVFQQPSDKTRNLVPVVNLFISDFVWATAYASGNNINFSAPVIKGFPSYTKFVFASILVHEMTHTFQWSGRGTAPHGLIEGVADYMRLKLKYYDPKAFAKPGAGKKWDEGYGVTARFLEYCDSLRPGFTATLNNMMRDVYKDSYFKDLLGKPLPQVWAEYKAKYSQMYQAKQSNEPLFLDI